MAKKNNRSDFDDFDDFSESEQKYSSQTFYSSPSTGENEDWAGSSRRDSGRRSTGRSRTGGGSGKLWLLAIPLVCVLLAVVLVMNLGGSDEREEMNDHRPDSSAGDTLPDDQPDDQPDFPDLPPVTQPVEPLVTSPAATEPPATEPPVADLVRFGYYGQRLTPEQQSAYAQICRGIRDYETTITGVILTNYEDLDPVVNAVFTDHAELFWFRGGYSTTYYTRDGYVEIDISPNYAFPREEGLACKAFVESATQDLLNQLSGKSEYEKVKGVYEYLIDNTIYDLAYKGTTIYDFLYYKRGVCEGYARMTQYLLDNLGVEAIYVSGEGGKPGKTESHAWNIVKVEGEYYQLDTTWGDPVSDDGTQSKNFNYFLITDEEMYRDHYPETYNLPSCTATACNYYHRESNFLVSYDPQVLAIWLTGAANRYEPLEFKCSSRQVFEETMRELFDNDKIWDVMKDALGTTYSVSYSWNDTMFTITINVEW